MRFGGILTAMVTPFSADGALAEDASAELMRHLLEQGSDGLVLAGTTGEGPTMSDDEKVALWEIGVAESGDAPVIAGTGSNDTRHTVELTERAAEAGADAALVVTPYYNRPNRRGVIEHFRAAAGASDLPIVLYNIPSRTTVDMSNDLLRELSEIPGVAAVKQARAEGCEPVEGLDLLAGNDDMLADVLDMGGTGGIMVASHLVGPEVRRMIDEPDSRRAIDEGLRPLYRVLGVTTNPIPVKAALAMAGHEVGGLRLPMVEASEGERAQIRSVLDSLGLLEGSDVEQVQSR
ncbi:MAG: 4-hydroxy-tetrahydrodipicolinate synthase [Actinomycetota bacterium]|nr:4-hydroxy-tetrahydrodipicolinate synthase [Actinomycetota bacterium]